MICCCCCCCWDSLRCASAQRGQTALGGSGGRRQCRHRSGPPDPLRFRGDGEARSVSGLPSGRGSGGARIPVCPAPPGTAGTGMPGSRPHCTPGIPGSGSIPSHACITWHQISARPSVGGHPPPTIGPVRKPGTVGGPPSGTGTIRAASCYGRLPSGPGHRSADSSYVDGDVLLGKLLRFFCHAVCPLVASDPTV